jgi:hypothetical protein
MSQALQFIILRETLNESAERLVRSIKEMIPEPSIDPLGPGLIFHRRR